MAAADDALLTAALKYAGRGWPVLWLSRRKRPLPNCPECKGPGPEHDMEACGCLVCHGPYAASTDPNRIAAMRAASPRGLLALRTGAACGLVVVDIDPAHGGQLIPDLMPPTAHVITGSGGLHLYYRHPGVRIPSTQGHIAPGVDVRGDPGYAVLPPCLHPRTRQPYRWAPGHHPVEMPPALVTASLPAPVVVPEFKPVGPYRPTSGITSPTALLDSLLGKVAAAPEGRRRATLFGASVGVGRMVAAGALSARDGYEALYAAGIAAGQSHRETHAAIVGGFRTEGVTP
ncbi:bifunctional DNA primase/polymerase [Catenulispora sp. NF23]|uniref:bifunctional DNA primase/polymerase n=1 Tax=Catenulispora pinistramenti TaxID=2705254 RepID=UPI001BAC2118|nr:bifunctional DNA primase/polymerase [Catenulispora pinistramenti]MBS2534154.1 bifunctional DNA primase/polymerase [Catenulispora pinistramenti]